MEYIKKSDAIKAITENPIRVACIAAKAINAIENLPPADVVPKSEVCLASRDAMTKLLELNGYAKTTAEDIKREVAREIFEEIEKLSHRFMNDKHYIFGDMVWDIAELKKKYTEGKG